jgi:hypothetical protein
MEHSFASIFYAHLIGRHETSMSHSQAHFSKRHLISLLLSIMTIASSSSNPVNRSSSRYSIRMVDQLGILIRLTGERLHGCCSYAATTITRAARLSGTG